MLKLALKTFKQPKNDDKMWHLPNISRLSYINVLINDLQSIKPKSNHPQIFKRFSSNSSVSTEKVNQKKMC